MKKTTKIVLGGVAALGLVGGGTALALVNANAREEASAKPSSSVSIVSPGAQGEGGAMPSGQPPGDMNGMPGGGMGGGPLADALAQALGVDANSVATAVQEVETDLGVQGPDSWQTDEFKQALASKLGVTVDDLDAAVSAMPQPDRGGQPPAGQAPGGQVPSEAPLAEATATSTGA